MSRQQVHHGRVSKKAAKACERCRSMKVKCSGTAPCTRCERKKEPCHFPVEENRVSIPESYLRELEHRYSFLGHNGSAPVLERTPGERLQNSRSRGMLQTPLTIEDEPLTSLNAMPGSHELPEQFPPDLPEVEIHIRESSPAHETAGGEFRQNPLADNDYTFARAPAGRVPDGRYWYMGPSSSWAFCRRVLAFIGQRVPGIDRPTDPWNNDGVAFQLEWKTLGMDEEPDITNLPPLDYGLFLFNSAKFHLGLMFQIVDEDRFLWHLHQFYTNPVVKSTAARFWYAQYLIILAFGKAFVSQVRSPSSLPGHQYAARAIALLPDLSGMHGDKFLAVEALALASLYLQSMDMRVAAFQHIGLALRMCIIEGIHRHMPEDVVGVELSRRCNMIFWIVYILDRDFSALIGAPSSIRDEDITAKLPSEMSQSLTALTMTLQIRLSRLTARILTTVYGVGKEFQNSLIKNTQSILHSLADLSQELTEFLGTQSRDPVKKVSKTATRLLLSYHHCVVLTTRPLVMCVLQKRVGQSGGELAQDLSLTGPVASLLQSCVESALAVIRTLRALGDDDQLEAFLPFQLEDVFSSSFLLHIIHIVTPELVIDKSWSENVEIILDQMISKGSVAAPLRKLELKQLEKMIQPLSPAAVRLSPTVPQLTVCPDPVAPHAPSPADLSQNVDENDRIIEEPYWDLFLSNGNLGLSHHELSYLADQLDDDDGGDDDDDDVVVMQPEILWRSYTTRRH